VGQFVTERSFCLRDPLFHSTASLAALYIILFSSKQPSVINYLSTKKRMMASLLFVVVYNFSRVMKEKLNIPEILKLKFEGMLLVCT